MPWEGEYGGTNTVGQYRREVTLQVQASSVAKLHRVDRPMFYASTHKIIVIAIVPIDVCVCDTVSLQKTIGGLTYLETRQNKSMLRYCNRPTKGDAIAIRYSLC